MYVALNPQKARNFTTKGIRLTLLTPVAHVGEDLEPEFRERIDQAIRDQVLYVVPDNEANGLIIPGIGSSGGVNSEEESRGDYLVKCNPDSEVQEIKDMFGTVRKTRKLVYTLTLPEDPEAEKHSGIILTDRR